MFLLSPAPLLQIVIVGSSVLHVLRVYELAAQVAVVTDQLLRGHSAELGGEQVRRKSRQAET